MKNCIVCHHPVNNENVNNNLHNLCVDEYLRRQQEKERQVKLLKPMIDEVNGGSPARLAEAIVDALTHSHRTLQQSFLSAVRIAITKYAALAYLSSALPRPGLVSRQRRGNSLFRRRL
jgi:hypothetical protein